MSKRDTIIYWTGFGVVVGLLIVAPLVLPAYWSRFVTEILIWGLLAMSSDILIGYTGMVSFGHSAFFGLGMYGAAAALLMVSPPNLVLALAFGLVAAAAVSAFVAYFSTRLRDIYFAITTLIFSQIFYVIIFTWTEVTGGENGLTFRRPAFGIPGHLDHAIHARDAALVRAGGGGGVLPDPAPHHAFAVRHGAAIDPRERAAHARDRLSGRALQDRRGDAVGPVRGTGRRALRRAEPLRRAGLRVLHRLRRGGDLQRHGRHRHAGRADRRRRDFLLLREGLGGCSASSSPI